METPPVYEQLRLLYFFWARQVLLEEYKDIRLVKVKDHPDMTPEEFVTRYLLWAAYNGVLQVFGDSEPRSMILVRRLRSDKLEYYRADYYGTIYEQDPDGDVSYIDFCYAPQNYSFIINILQRLGTKYLAWTRDKTGEFHIMPAEKMPVIGESVLSKSLICWRFIDPSATHTVQS